MTRQRIIEALRTRPREIDELSTNLGIDKATIRSCIAQHEKGTTREPVVEVNEKGQLYVKGGPDYPARNIQS